MSLGIQNVRLDTYVLLEKPAGFLLMSQLCFYMYFPITTFYCCSQKLTYAFPFIP